MSIDLKSLRCFLAVVETGNVTRAAEAMHMTQPALSVRLKQLAEVSGLTLFRRSGRGLNLTDDGLAYSVKAAQVVAALSELEQTARQLQGNIRGTLRIGTVIDPEFIRLGAFLGRLVESAPLLKKELRQGMSGNVADWVLRGEVDAGYFLGDLPPSAGRGADGRTDPLASETGRARGAHADAPAVDLRFAQIILTHFSYWVIAPRGWEQRVLGRGWEGLAQLPWIGTADASVHRRLLRTVCEPMGIQLHDVAKVDQESSMLAMVRAGVGLSLCRDSIALSEKRSHGLVVNDRVQIRCPLSFIALQARRAEPGIAVAFDLLAELWTETGRAEVRPHSFEVRKGRVGPHEVQLRQPADGVVDE